MTKLTGKERLAITIELETLLEKECRPCKVEGKEHLSACAGCDTFTKLRTIGERLEGDHKVSQVIPVELRRQAEINGVSYVTLSRRLANGMLPEDAVKRMNGSRPRWSDKEDRLLMELDEDGLLHKEIAKKLARTVPSVRNRIHVLRERGLTSE